jgi:hypothetical protein
VKYLRRLLSFVVACIGVVPLAAAQPPIEIARIKVLVAEDGWEVREGPPFNLVVDQGFSGSAQGQTKVMVLRDPDSKPLAVLLVGATWGRSGVIPNGTCPRLASAYVRDFTNGRFDTPECLRFGGPFNSEVIIASSLPRMREAQKLMQIDLPPRAYSVLVYMTNRNGSVVAIEGLLAPSFVGVANRKPAEIVPPSIPSTLAAWADALGEAALASVRSMGGELAIPKIEFQSFDKPKVSNQLRAKWTSFLPRSPT